MLILYVIGTELSLLSSKSLFHYGNYTSKLHRTSYYNSVFETNLYNYVSGSRNNKILQSIKDIYIECSRSMIEDNYFKVIHINKNATSNVVHSVTIQDKNGTNYNLINQYSSSYDERQYNEFSGVNGLSGYIIIDWDLISQFNITMFKSDRTFNKLFFK